MHFLLRSQMEVDEGKLGTISRSMQHSSVPIFAITDVDDPMSSLTSILKAIAEKTIPKTSLVQKRFNKTFVSQRAQQGPR